MKRIDSYIFHHHDIQDCFISRLTEYLSFVDYSGTIFKPVNFVPLIVFRKVELTIKGELINGKD